jgi:septal ring factor EnvC (AmiA/AmiB activator)
MFTRFILLALIFLMLPTIGQAEDTPVPPTKTKSLEIVRQLLEHEEKNKVALDKKAKKAEKDIAEVKDKLVDVTAKIRKNESRLKETEQRIQQSTVREQEITSRLEKDYGSISNTILALERMRRIPPELMIVRPGAPIEAAQTSMLLKNLIPALGHRADSLARDLSELEKIRQQLEKDKVELVEAKAELDKQYPAMQKLLQERESSFKSVNAAYRASAARAEQMAAEAQSLAELVQRLEDAPAPTQIDKPRPKKSARPSRAAKRAAGRGAILPVSGPVLASFGDHDEMGAEILGLKIKTPSKAIVVTPMDGTVKYAGTFRNYGQIVIVEHQSGLHSLVAGMSTTDVSTGQSLKSGEPIGYMPSASSQDGPLTLYYELRQNGDPVDPSSLFSDFKS